MPDFQARAKGTTLRRPNPYDRDPPSPSASRQPTVDESMFDLGRVAEAMRRGQVSGIPRELRYPNDRLLAATMMNLGMPRFAAEQVRHNPQLRHHFLQMWAAVQLAAEGHVGARERVDVARATFEQLRRQQMISSDPRGARQLGYSNTP